MKIRLFGASPGGLALALAAAFPLAFPAAAQNRALPGTVVTASRGALSVDELVSDVTVIDRAAIEAAGARTLPELLARSAGVQMTATGGLGKTSGVFLRGTESRHTILLIDGVRMGSATAGIPIWEGIPLEMIERIEVLKGPASALYGSEGVGGVVQIFTRAGRTGFHPQAALTAGSHGHALASAGVAAGQGPLSYSFGLQRLQERAVSSTNARVPFGNHNPDRDPFEQEAVNASVRYAINADWRLDAGLLYSDGVSAYDDGPNVDARTALRSVVTQAGVRGRVAPGWQSELRAARSADQANILRANFPGAFQTTQTQFMFQNHIDTPWGVVLAGLENRQQEVSGSTAYVVTRRSLNSAFGGLNGSAGAHSWQFNLRRDLNSQFDDVSTGFAGYGYRIAPAWRVHASYGTSYVAPSFNQLYFPRFGNPALQPERGRNTDLGLAWTPAGHELKLVRFDNQISGFMTNTTLPENIPQARIQGWTLSHAGDWGGLKTRASLDHLDPRNETRDRQLPRRAARQIILGADQPLGAWRVGASLLYVGERFDDAANTTRLPSYSTVDLYADWQFDPQWSLQARINNLADKSYETALGYNQPGRGAYLTLRWQPK